MDANICSTTSPIESLLPSVAASVERIAPEIATMIDEATDAADLEINDSLDWICGYAPEQQKIVLSTTACSVVWLLAYGSYLIYAAHMAGTQPEGQEIDLEADQAMDTGRAALRWATQTLLDGKARESWPPNSATPAIWSPDSDAEPTAEAVATDICLCALAILLHHEIAHHRLKHSAEIASPSQEQEADYEAARWVLGDGTLPDPVVRKRGFGVVVALTLMMLPGIYTGNHGGATHPRGFDRLVNTLDRHFGRDNDHIWSFVVGTMKLHLDNAGVRVPPGPFDNFRECVDAYVEVLAAQAADHRLV